MKYFIKLKRKKYFKLVPNVAQNKLKIKTLTSLFYKLTDYHCRLREVQRYEKRCAVNKYLLKRNNEENNVPGSKHVFLLFL